MYLGTCGNWIVVVQNFPKIIIFENSRVVGALRFQQRQTNLIGRIFPSLVIDTKNFHLKKFFLVIEAKIFPEQKIFVKQFQMRQILLQKNCLQRPSLRTWVRLCTRVD